VEVLVGQRQRDEADDVEHPDEHEEGGDVGKPPFDGPAREVPLHDLSLHEVVERLPRGLSPVRPQRESEAHDPDAEHDRQRGADPEVDDRLVDREDAEVHPGVEPELVLGMEVLLGCEEERVHGFRPE
jgi:hypothetical protein